MSSYNLARKVKRLLNIFGLLTLNVELKVIQDYSKNMTSKSKHQGDGTHSEQISSKQSSVYVMCYSKATH